VSIIFKTDEEIEGIAEVLWRDLVSNSNDGKYGEFTKNFSRPFAKAMNQVEAGHQFANSELARNLAAKQGEWLGRLVLGLEDEQVRIFGATIF